MIDGGHYPEVSRTPIDHHGHIPKCPMPARGSGTDTSPVFADEHRSRFANQCASPGMANEESPITSLGVGAVTNHVPRSAQRPAVKTMHERLPASTSNHRSGRSFAQTTAPLEADTSKTVFRLKIASKRGKDSLFFRHQQPETSYLPTRRPAPWRLPKP